MRTLKLFILLPFFMLLCCHCKGQFVPRLVKSFSLLPGTFTGTITADLDGRYVFNNLGELWTSDGTDTGTYLLKAFIIFTPCRW